MLCKIFQLYIADTPRKEIKRIAFEVLMVEKTPNVDLECNLRDTVASIKYGLTLASLNVLLFR